MQKTFTRFMLVVAFFIFWIGAIGVRLVHLQVNQHEWLRKKALSQKRDQQKSKMLRGSIYDRTGRTLAMSVSVKSLYADPSEIKDTENFSQRVSEVLKINRKKLLKKLKIAKAKKRRFLWIARKLDEESVEKVNDELVNGDLKKHDLPKFQGLHWAEEQKRRYPYKTLASHIIGFSDLDDVGRAGVELSQEDVLRGDVVKKWQKRDRLGRVYSESYVESSAVQEPPRDVVLTISNSIQYKTEKALAKGAKNARARSGKAIVLDPKTGEILAMANYPFFDPNKFNKLSPGQWKNKGIQNIYSPGSVFKLITYGAALEENLIKPYDEVDCGEGNITISGHTFNDSHKIGRVSYTKALAHSSNVGAIKTALKVGKNNFYKYSQKFGFGQQTGVKLPAEAGGILRHPRKWNNDSLASMSIGYEIGVTTLQTASAFATIANGGVRIQPHIIKEIRKADGEIVTTTKPKKIKVVSDKTAENLRDMFREVVLKGTGKRAQLNGYTSAGKTGTAWKYDPKLKKVNQNKYISSFIGFAPADNPTIVIAVVMDEPKGAFRNGGQVAAPVFREIAEQVLPGLGVIPDGTVPQDLSEEDEIPEEIENQDAKKEKDEKEKNKKAVKKKEEKLRKKTEKTKEKDKKKNSSEEKKKATASKKGKPRARNKSSTERKKRKT